MPNNDQVKGYLERILQTGNIPNALLFTGPLDAQKELFVELFAKQLLLTEDLTHHPDCYVYKPEGKVAMHSIERLREFIKEVYLPPFTSQRKLFIFYEADRMLTYGANALLKTLEEPTSHSIIILLTSHLEKLLPTILSRCSVVRFQATLTEQPPLDEQDPLKAQVLQLLAQGKFKSYHELLQAVKELTQSVEAIIEEDAKQRHVKMEASYPEGMTALQSQAIQKESDGISALYLAQITQMIFDTMYSWYRDMHLICLNGNRNYLFNPNYIEPITQAAQRGEILPLEAIEPMLQEATLSIERSTPLNMCLEHLFLSLRMQN